MKFKDKIIFFLAKFLKRKIVLFSSKEDWEWSIRKRVIGYVPFFYEFDKINLNNFDVIVPLTLHAQRYINSHPKSFTKQLYICPSDYCIELCNDKVMFHNYLAKNGFQQFTPIINEKFSYPYIIKKRIGAWGEGISIITDTKSEMEHISEIESEEYFTQQYIKGQDEYTAHIIIAAKRIVFFRALKFTFQDEYFVKGKDFNPTSVEEVNHDNFKPIFEEILLSINYQGICCFNYKITTNGLKIFEVNPRYGASMTRFINEALIDYSIYGAPNKKVQRTV